MNKKNFLDKSGVSYLWQRIKNLLFERELEYPKPVDNQLIYSEDNKFINNFLMRNDDILVVDNEVDFEICTQPSDIETDILGAWQQFTDSTIYSPEYGSGSYLNVHENSSTSGELTPGYGYWYTEEDTDEKIKILNKINSGDFNGYIMPLYKSNYSFDSVFGTKDGNTSGDEIGFSIVNDKNASPNSIKTNSGRTYYRNTLYDIYLYDETTAPRVPLKSAWVCEDLQQDKAYVFYTDSPTKSGETEAAIISNFNTGTSFNIYELNNIKLSKGRKPFKISTNSEGITQIVIKDTGDEAQVFSTETFVEKSESYGEIYMVNFAVTNSTSFYAKRASTTLDSAGGGITLYVWGVVFYKNQSTNNWSVEYRKIIEGGSNGLGQKIIPWISNCDSYSKPCIIRSLVNFENGKLFVKFSNPSSVEYNDSQELIDFNNNELCIDFTKNTYYVNSREEENGEVKITEIQPITQLPDFTHNESSVWNKFTGETKFMYDAFSYANLYIKCHNIAIDNIVLHVDKTSAKYGVWGLNEERKYYVKLIDIDNNQIDPCEYLAGSRMSYNNLTKKLFYSDGEKIYQVAEGIIDRDSLKGDPGEPGATGLGLEYDWNGTQLGVRKEGDVDFEYTDLIGPTGVNGLTIKGTIEPSIFINQFPISSKINDAYIVSRDALSGEYPENAKKGDLWICVKESEIVYDGELSTVKEPVFNFSEVNLCGPTGSTGEMGNSILFYEDEITTDENDKVDVPASFSVRVGDLVIDENFNLYKCIEE